MASSMELADVSPLRKVAAIHFRAEVIQWSVLIFTIFLVMAPLIPIVFQSFLDRALYDSSAQMTLSNYGKLVSNSGLRSVLVNTLIFSALTTIIAQVVGALFAILVGRTDMPGRQALNSLMLVPLVVSSLVLAFGWSLSYGPSGFVTLFAQSFTGEPVWNLNTILGMSLVAATTQVPLSFLYCLAAVSMIDPALEEAARSCGAKPLRVFSRVTLPLMFPSLVFGTVLNFTAALDSFSIPFIFGEAAGIRLFMTFLYFNGLRSPNPDYGFIATAALLLLIIVGLLVFIQSRLLRNSKRFVTVGGKASHPRRFSLGRFRWPAFALVGSYLLFLVIFPIGVLVLRAFTSFLSPLVPFWSLFTLENFRRGHWVGCVYPADHQHDLAVPDRRYGRNRIYRHDGNRLAPVRIRLCAVDRISGPRAPRGSRIDRRYRYLLCGRVLPPARMA